MKLRVFFPAGIPRTVEAAEILGDDVLQLTSSGRTTAQGDTKQGRKTRENAQKTLVRAERTKAQAQNQDTENMNVSSYYSLGGVS